MNRVVAGALGLLAGAALLVGCSDDKSASTASAGDTQASTGGSTEEVDGKDLANDELDRGQARFGLVDDQRQPVAESTAWNHDWQGTEVTVGADVDESPETRRRVRHFARTRLAAPADDAYLAEVLAAESDY